MRIDKNEERQKNDEAQFQLDVSWLNNQLQDWIGQHNFAKITCPVYKIDNELEAAICFLLVLWLQKHFGITHEFLKMKDSKARIRIDRNNSFKDDSIWVLIREISEILQEKSCSDFDMIEGSWFKVALQEDLFGSLLQKKLVAPNRKSLASNYTPLEASRALVSLLHENFKPRVVMDPFCGSGRLITAFLRSPAGSHVKEIIINDLMPAAVLLSFCRILQELDKQGRLNDIKVTATIGDAFRRFQKEPLRTHGDEWQSANLVLINPPFTRIHAFHDQQEIHLNWLRSSYPFVFQGQSGLHVFSLCLAHSLLSTDGLLAAVLPVSTFLSNYSSVLKSFLLDSFSDIKLGIFTDRKSLSEDSLVRELFFLSRKNQSRRTGKADEHVVVETLTKKSHHSKNQHPEDERVEFVRFRGDCRRHNFETESNHIELNLLRNEWNWTRFFHTKQLAEFTKKILATGKIHTGKHLQLELVRGVEMYGPNFFFLPNKYWDINEKTDTVVRIQGKQVNKQGNEIDLPCEYFLPILRKPGNYAGYITPHIEDHVLSIPTIPSRSVHSKNLQKYIEQMNNETHLAQNRFGKEWLSHIYKQLETKKPYGYTFVIDKTAITQVSNLSIFLDEKISCSKNFYVFRNLPYKKSKLLAAWMNSSFFILLFLSSRREIGGSYGRLQISDYMKERLFIDMDKIDEDTAHEILRTFDALRSQKLPPIKQQLAMKQRFDLDRVFLKLLELETLNIDEYLALLFDTLKQALEELEKRDNGKTGREY